jgi:hypothetical protein
MSNVAVDLFVEDRAHEEFISRMLQRLARENEQPITTRIRAARGGHGRVLQELTLYQQLVAKSVSGSTMPDLLVVAIDANCKSFSAATREIADNLDAAFRDRAVLACPDPHIERWYMADAASFREVVGIRPTLGKKKCERDLYKDILATSITKAGHPPTLGGIEFAQELVESMDLYRAGKFESSLKHFVEAAVGRLRMLRESE